MEERKVWIINTGDPIEHINISLKKHIYLKPNIPQQFPLKIGMEYASRYKTVRLCNNPQQYFTDRKLKKLIVRDAGIGDLLMLEPILRKAADENIEIDVACMYPEVYENHPKINKVIKLTYKEGIEVINFRDYDCWEDLRNYSETSPLRNQQHRTDIYNELFNIEMTEDEKQPKLYFKENEEPYIKKREGYRYIGVQCDASHSYRRYDRGLELIEYLLKKDRNNIVVLMGSYDLIATNKDKRIIDLQGKTTRREAIRVIRDLDYFIAADSGLMHVALALHTPVVCMFSIITPDFRLRYYKGHRRVIWKDLPCRGCGDWHMTDCKHGSKKADFNYLAPCMNIPPEEIYEKMMEMPFNPQKRIFYGDKIDIVLPHDKDNGKKKEPIKANILTRITSKKLVMPIIVLNEEKNLPRFIENVMKHPCIEKTIAIDGGSSDKTVEMLEKAGAQVYTHQYDKNYHDMQAMQRNYSCSFIRDGQKIIIMDIDECFSPELYEYLYELASSNIEYGLISRRTFNYYADINDPNKQIKDYPDYQPRFFTWNRRFKWVGSPHHNVYNVPAPIRIDKDIIHFEKENKDRDGLEKKWADMQKKTLEVYR